MYVSGIISISNIEKLYWFGISINICFNLVSIPCTKTLVTIQSLFAIGIYETNPLQTSLRGLVCISPHGSEGLHKKKKRRSITKI